MIKLNIDNKPLETILKDLAIGLESAKSRIDKQDVMIGNLENVLLQQKSEIVRLQSQIIEIQTAETNERSSIWGFLTGWAKKEPKVDDKPVSRMTESLIVLDK